LKKDDQVGNIIKFQKPGKWPNGTWQRKISLNWFPRRKRWWLIIAGVLGLLIFDQHAFESLIPDKAAGTPIICNNPAVTDGDTFRCASIRIRLANIDAPEMAGHCREGRRCTPGNPIAAKDYLHSLSRGSVTCKPIEKDKYGRTVALCTANGKDLSCAMVSAGHAVERYGSLSCP
jgi:endonuclease YncB( thermonuclease family)